MRIWKLWRREGEGTCWIGGEGQKPLFLKKKERKDGFLWKNMWLSGDTEILPCRGFILPQTVYNGCT